MRGRGGKGGDRKRRMGKEEEWSKGKEMGGEWREGWKGEEGFSLSLLSPWLKQLLFFQSK